MNPQIIAERDNTLILFESGKVKTVPNTLYNQVKYREFKGDRISYHFNDDMYVQETFDNGIFNAFINEETIQIRDSVTLCESIIAHKETNDTDLYDKLFKKLYLRENKDKIMKEMVVVFGDRVKMVKHKESTSYIIDERFMVDDHGVSHYKDDKGNWRFLCTVAQGNLSKMSITTSIGDIELESNELTIMGKIGFLLTPDITDHVFFHQLSDKMQDVLKAEVEFDTVNLGGT
tara:strand:- start:127 stop:822 length:696 start_codon:yes stop_codon:yes gene_type:complete